MITKIILISTVAGLKTVDRSDVQLKQSLIEDAGQDDWTGVLEDNVGSVDSLTPKIRHLGVLKSIKDFMSQVITFIAQWPENLYLKFTGKMLRPRGLRYGLRVVSVVFVPLIFIGATALVVKGIYYFFIQSGSSPDPSSSNRPSSRLGSYRPSSRPEWEEKGEAAAQLAGSSTENIKDYLKYHNCYREKVNAPHLTWSNELADFAQKKAKAICDQLGCAIHPQGHDFMPRKRDWGENLGQGNSSFVGATWMWWKEHKNYELDDPVFKLSTGHFTQVAWKETKELGCGFYKPPGSTDPWQQVHVCLYKPFGNFPGRFTDNVE